MTPELTASALIEAMLADIGKTQDDYAGKGDKSQAARERLMEAAIEWVYDQTCATALAEFERCAALYTGNPISGDDD